MANDEDKAAPAAGQPEPVEISPEQAAQVVEAAVGDMRQRWLRIAVTVANAIKNGQAVSNGTFEDLRQLREKYEELERARLILRNIGSTGDSPPAPSAH